MSGTSPEVAENSFSSTRTDSVDVCYLYLGKGGACCIGEREGLSATCMVKE